MTTEADTIRANVDAILSAAGVSMQAVCLGETKRDNWVCDAWKVTFIVTSDQRAAGVEFDYFTGTGLRKPVEWKHGAPGYDNGRQPLLGTLLYEQWMTSAKPEAPHAADVLRCLTDDVQACHMSFNDWADTYGYDTDSRKAFKIYEACQESGDKLKKVFTHAQIAQLREALQDY